MFLKTLKSSFCKIWKCSYLGGFCIGLCISRGMYFEYCGGRLSLITVDEGGFLTVFNTLRTVERH